MTPMVDFGFLLISFFVITTELSKPTAMDLAMTKDGPPMPLAESSALTVLIDKGNTIYYYEGKWEEALQDNKIKQTRLTGLDNIRSIINAKQKKLDADVKSKEKRDGLMLLIKPGNDANYRTIVDSINNYVELNSIESKEQITVRLAEKRLKQLQGQLVRVHEQVKVKLASANSLQVEVKIAEVALKDALTIGKQQIEYVK